MEFGKFLKMGFLRIKTERVNSVADVGARPRTRYARQRRIATHFSPVVSVSIQRCIEIV
jgi:hypothetical protein